MPRVDRAVNVENVRRDDLHAAIVRVRPADAVLEIGVGVQVLAIENIAADLEAKGEREEVAEHVRRRRIGRLVVPKLLACLVQPRAPANGARADRRVAHLLEEAVVTGVQALEARRLEQHVVDRSKRLELVVGRCHRVANGGHGDVRRLVVVLDDAHDVARHGLHEVGNIVDSRDGIARLERRGELLLALLRRNERLDRRDGRRDRVHARVAAVVTESILDHLKVLVKVEFSEHGAARVDRRVEEMGILLAHVRRERAGVAAAKRNPATKRRVELDGHLHAKVGEVRKGVLRRQQLEAGDRHVLRGEALAVKAVLEGEDEGAVCLGILNKRKLRNVAIANGSLAANHKEDRVPGALPVVRVNKEALLPRAVVRGIKVVHLLREPLRFVGLDRRSTEQLVFPLLIAENPVEKPSAEEVVVEGHSKHASRERKQRRRNDEARHIERGKQAGTNRQRARTMRKRSVLRNPTQRRRGKRRWSPCTLR
eukprot:Opistho-1_new@27579